MDAVDSVDGTDEVNDIADKEVKRDEDAWRGRVEMILRGMVDGTQTEEHGVVGAEQGDARLGCTKVSKFEYLGQACPFTI